MDKIDLVSLNDEEIVQDVRPYLGLSMIGNKCSRYLQYYHYMTFKSEYSARIQRLFDVGHAAEKLMIADLAKVGIEVTGRQTEIIGFAGHWKGHIDGKGNKIFLVEFKTHNEKWFKDLLKKKVKESKPGHYDQMQSYMGYLDLSRCLYMALNKNDSTYYFEWIEFDKERFHELMRKEEDIIMTSVLLPRIGNNNRAWFECKMCDAKEVCFEDSIINKNCRSCQNVDVEDAGRWRCSYFGKTLDTREQKIACDNYTLAEMFT